MQPAASGVHASSPWSQRNARHRRPSDATTLHKAADAAQGAVGAASPSFSTRRCLGAVRRRVGLRDSIACSTLAGAFAAVSAPLAGGDAGRRLTCERRPHAGVARTRAGGGVAMGDKISPLRRHPGGATSGIKQRCHEAENCRRSRCSGDQGNGSVGRPNCAKDLAHADLRLR